jgi:DNA-binding transcriptional ArsR family regulator
MNVTDSPAAWRAVAHPVRRRLIELLADGPRTTGDLACAFPVTRFAVMKHLAVLERSGVITVRREGRQRWNALAVASGLEFSIGPASHEQPTAARSGPASLVPFHLQVRVPIAASAARVFDALTFNLSGWWGAPYLRSARATNVVLEPQLGGRLFEEWGHRQGFLRGVVTAIRQDERLELAGRIAGSGCVPGVLEISLAPAASGTLVTGAHRGVAEGEAVTAGGEIARLQEAWDELLGVRLQAFVERGTRAGIAELPPAGGALFGWF